MITERQSPHALAFKLRAVFALLFYGQTWRAVRTRPTETREQGIHKRMQLVGV